VSFAPRGGAVALVCGDDPAVQPRKKPDEVRLWDLGRLLER
jgi:hypothetical protein